MKQKLVLLMALGLFGSGAFAQSNQNGSADKKASSIGIHFNAVDFKTPETLKDAGTPRNFYGLKDMDFGFSLSYWKGLTKHVDFSTKFNTIFHNYANDRNQATTKSELGLELEPTLNLRPFSDASVIAPFLTAGIGGGYYTGDFGAYVPAGVGLQVNFNSRTYLMLQGQYRFSLTEKVVKDNILYSVGFVQSLAPERVAPPIVQLPVVSDRDNDGVVDADDRCPDVAGLAALKGCPDKDGDGIADMDDKCPDVAGTAKYEGCPVPDTDGDGINDEMDKCPTVAGVAKYNGCPVPDTDGDGVNDEMDKCPTRPGTAENQGCPEITKEVREKVSFAAKNIFFATGNYKLLSKSHKSLNAVADLMKADESLMLDIDGHTDAVGSDESNQVLSDKRAASVRDYLISQGIDASRLKSTGYGETKPVADNNTAAGRAKNRRTEMTVRNY